MKPWWRRKLWKIPVWLVALLVVGGALGAGTILSNVLILQTTVDGLGLEVRVEGLEGPKHFETPYAFSVTVENQGIPSDVPYHLHMYASLLNWEDYLEPFDCGWIEIALEPYGALPCEGPVDFFAPNGQTYRALNFEGPPDVVLDDDLDVLPGWVTFHGGGAWTWFIFAASS